MITLSEDKLIEILLCFEMQINKEKAELLEKKRQEWNILEKSMSDPFTEIDYDKLGYITKDDIEKHLKNTNIDDLIERYSSNKSKSVSITEFEMIIDRLVDEGNEWAFSYKKSADWIKFIINQQFHNVKIHKRISDSKPTLIISYGPSGSGKSSNINSISIYAVHFNPVITGVS